MSGDNFPRYSPDEAIARDRFRVWGNLTDHDYLVAWSRRLVELVDVAEPHDEHEAELQAARRVAVALLEAEDAGEPWPAVDLADEAAFDALQVWPDIDLHVRIVRGEATQEEFDALARTAPPEPVTTSERLAQYAEVVHDVSRGRSSGFLFMAILVFPLGCAFVAAFLIAITIIGALLALIGLADSQFAGQVALVGAIAIAAAVVVAVYRRVIPRLPWLRRLVNR